MAPPVLGFNRFGGQGPTASRGFDGGAGRRASFIGPVAGFLGSPAGGNFSFEFTGDEDFDPEDRIAAIRNRDLLRGGVTLERGTQALERFDPGQFLGADALSSIFDQATRSNFLPQLRSLQARNAARGVRGPISGALEGDLASGFQRNLLAEVARAGGQRASLDFSRAQQLAEIGGAQRAQGISLLGTELELGLARQLAEQQRKSRRKRGIAGLIGSVGGGLIGSAFGAGGLGASIGSKLGGIF